MIEYLKSSELVLNQKFQTEIEAIRLGALARKETKELDKFINLIILCCLNSELSSQIEFLPGDLLDLSLSIFDLFVVNEESGRDSIRVSIQKRSSVYASKISDSSNDGKSDFPSKKGSIYVKKDDDEYINQLLEKIKILEEKLNKEIDNEEKITKMQNENESLNKKLLLLEKKFKDNEFKLSIVNKENEGNKTKIAAMLKENSKVAEMKSQIKELTEKVETKELEKNKMKREYQDKEEKLKNQIEQLNSKIEIIQEKEIINRDLKKNFEKLNSNYQIMQERCNKYETLKKDYAELKKFVESKNKNGEMPLTVSEKEKVKKYELELKSKDNIIDKKEKRINELLNQIENMKEEQKMHSKMDSSSKIEKISEFGDLNNVLEGNNDKEENNSSSKFCLNKTPFATNRYEYDDNEIDIFRESKEMKESKYRSKEDENLIIELNKKLKELTEDLVETKEEKERLEDKFNKETEEERNKLQKEFELISSAMYNLGVKFWNMKYDYEHKINQTPSWLIKERQKQLNGDY